MRRLVIWFASLTFLLWATVGMAEEGKVCKVLPQFLDKQGRQSLSPSLYERDAYQAFLRKHPKERSALQLAVQWKAKDVDWPKLKLRAEMRGLLTNTISTITLEQPAKKNGHFTSWANLVLDGSGFQKFGALVAWRVTLWDGDRQLGELKSFLWSGVAERAP